MLQAILVIGQYAYCPFQSGNTGIARNFWAIRVLPGYIWSKLPRLPDHTIRAILVIQLLIRKDLFMKFDTMVSRKLNYYDKCAIVTWMFNSSSGN